MTEQLWMAVVGLVGIILGALITGIYNLRAKRNEYVNDYYKTVIDRRIAAYEQLESLIVALKTCVLDADGKPYHLLFSKDDDWQSAYNLLFSIISHALWLSDDAFEKTRDLNYKIFRLKPSESSAIEFGKENYEIIAEFRSDLENILSADMLELYDVKKFLKCKKKKKSGFHNVNLHR